LDDLEKQSANDLGSCSLVRELLKYRLDSEIGRASC